MTVCYKKYKESDNEWSKKIPYQWDEKRVKDLFRLVTEKAQANHEYELLSLYASIGVKPRKDLEARGNKASSTDDYWLVKKGDIVVNKLLAWMGAVGLSEYDGVTSPAYDIVRKISDQVDTRYYSYLFRTEIAKQIFKKNSRGIMDMRLRLYFDKLGALTVPFPGIQAQTAIANYLDTKTAQIDKKVGLLRQKLNYYKKLKQALINETVTKGLDDSANEIIPFHWSIVRVKDLSEINKKNLPESTDFDFSFKYLDISGVTYGSSNLIFEEVSFGSSPSRARRVVHDEDVLISTVRTYLKAITKIKDSNNIIASTGFAVLSPNDAVFSGFFAYFILSDVFLDQINKVSKGVSYPAVTSTDIGRLFVYLPPKPEQILIANYLDKKTKCIDKIVTYISQQVEHLKELRSNLINDVVTGKFKVTSEDLAA